jgi:hypothetical protein
MLGAMPRRGKLIKMVDGGRQKEAIWEISGEWQYHLESDATIRSNRFRKPRFTHQNFGSR